MVLEKIIKHPLIAIFIMKKWQKARIFFLIKSLIYLFFLISYSVLIYHMFGPTHWSGVKINDTISTEQIDAIPGSAKCDDPLCSEGRVIQG